MNNTQEREFGWDDVIEQDSQFIEIPEGDYNFTVQSFERERFDGSEKMPACNCAKLTLLIEFDGNQVPLETRLFLHSKSEWKLSEFFASIGQKKKGEKLRMNWNTVPGSGGKCKVGSRMYNGSKYSEVKKFYPDANYEQKQQVYANSQSSARGGYTPGNF